VSFSQVSVLVWVSSLGVSRLPTQVTIYQINDPVLFAGMTQVWDKVAPNKRIKPDGTFAKQPRAEGSGNNPFAAAYKGVIAYKFVTQE
tara:strand:+ start:88 stop:351 length:264 start_codon:yes stop_codon:yes gene_type:complete